MSTHAEILAKLLAQKPARCIPRLGELPATRGLEDKTAAEYARDRAIARAAEAKRTGRNKIKPPPAVLNDVSTRTAVPTENPPF